MGRARQEWGQQRWQPGTLGRYSQEWREPGPKPGPEEQSEQPVSQVRRLPSGACQEEGMLRSGLICGLQFPSYLSDSYSHLSGRPVRKKTEEEEKLLKLLQGIPRPQDGFTQWCEQMLHTLSTAGSLDGTEAPERLYWL
jgi:hypothetical protein